MVRWLGGICICCYWNFQDFSSMQQIMTVVSVSVCQPPVLEQGSGESKSDSESDSESESENESGEVKVGRLEG